MFSHNIKPENHVKSAVKKIKTLCDRCKDA